MAGGPDRPGGPPEAIFQHFPKWCPKWRPKMGSKNGVQNGVKTGVQKWGPKWRPKWGPEMGSKNGVQNWGPSCGGRQLPSLRAATTTNKNEKSPLSVSSGSGKRAHTLPLHRRFAGRWGERMGRDTEIRPLTAWSPPEGAGGFFVNYHGFHPKRANDGPRTDPTQP